MIIPYKFPHMQLFHQIHFFLRNMTNIFRFSFDYSGLKKDLRRAEKEDEVTNASIGSEIQLHSLSNPCSNTTVSIATLLYL